MEKAELADMVEKAEKLDRIEQYQAQADKEETVVLMVMRAVEAMLDIGILTNHIPVAVVQVEYPEATVIVESLESLEQKVISEVRDIHTHLIIQALAQDRLIGVTRIVCLE